MSAGQAPSRNALAVRRYRAKKRDAINAQARQRWADQRAARGDPCMSHACDGCRSCRVLAKCCRGDNPDYRLPPLGSFQPVFGDLGLVREDADMIQCHACGDWFRRLTQHIWHQHDLTSNEYRSVFGLARMQPLVAPAERAAMSMSLDPYKSASPERMAEIRPTPERTAMLSARPERLQATLIKNVTRKIRIRELNQRQKGRPRPRHRETCSVCGASYAVPPANARTRKTCGSRECVVRWRELHPPVHSAKLSAAQVDAIRVAYAAGGISHQQLGRSFGVSGSTVYLIVNGKTWVAKER